jgi:hypothetical protein
VVSWSVRAMQNRVFFPQLLLDQWGIEGKIDLNGSELVVLAEGRKYRIEESVYVVTEVTGANDPHGFIGKVKPKAALDEMGAEILENSMILGDNAYDVVPGWAGAPESTFKDHLHSTDRMAARGGKTDMGSSPKNDEEMLKRFVEGTL